MPSPSTINEHLPSAAEPDPQRDDRAALVARALSVAYVHTLDGFVAGEQFVTDIPIAFARKFCILGLELPGINGNGHRRHLTVALSEPSSLEQVDVVGRFLGCTVTPLFA